MATLPCSLCIKLPKDLVRVANRKTILISLYVLLKNDISRIEIISQQINNFIWRITFEEGYDASFLVGEKIRIESFDITIEDFNEFAKHKYMKYKVMWLPHKFPKDKIESFFRSSQVKNIEITEEVIKEKIEEIPDLPEFRIKTGNFFVKLKVENTVENLQFSSGINEIDKNRIFIIKSGEKIRCLKCNQEGHIRKNCPTNNLVCIKCKKTGHKADRCNIALATRVENENLPDEEDTILDIDLIGMNSSELGINNENQLDFSKFNFSRNENQLDIENKKRKKGGDISVNSDCQESKKKDCENKKEVKFDEKTIAVSDINLETSIEYSDSDK